MLLVICCFLVGLGTLPVTVVTGWVLGFPSAERWDTQWCTPMLEQSTGGIYEVLVVLGHFSIIGSEDKLYKRFFPGRGGCETNTRVWKSRGVILELSASISGQDVLAGFWTVSCPHPFTLPNRLVCFPQPLPKNRGLQKSFH